MDEAETIAWVSRGRMGCGGREREKIFTTVNMFEEKLSTVKLSGHGLGGVSSFDPGIHVCGADRY